MNFRMKNQSKKIGIIISLALITVSFVILMLDMEASFSRAFDRDFFSHGRDRYLERGEVFHEENVAWALLKGTKEDCEQWIRLNDWEEGVQWRTPSSNQKSHKDKWFRKIFNQYNVNPEEIDRIHSKIVDGSDAAYLIVLSKSTDEDCLCIVCVFRS